MITAQERQIARELSMIYLAYAGIVTATHMATDWGSVPQWITAIVAVFAVLVAAVGIAVQRSVARKRAAVDFFIKTEMDRHLLDSYDDFWTGIDCMKTMEVGAFYGSKEKKIRKHYFSVRKYLNVHELIAVGIKSGMLDDRTCFDFWCDVLVRGVEAARPLIDYLSQRPDHEALPMYFRHKLRSDLHHQFDRQHHRFWRLLPRTATPCLLNPATPSPADSLEPDTPGASSLGADRYRCPGRVLTGLPGEM
jgi:hypothetical protein